MTESALPTMVIGFIREGSAQGSARWVGGFQKGFSETGYVEGKNVTVEYHPVAVFPCGFHPIVLLPIDAAFAGAAPILPAPCPPAPVSHVPAWFWAAFACPASIILSGIVANFKDNRQLTYAEAWTCGLLYWFGQPPAQQKHR
jgi:hypothetical protein